MQMALAKWDNQNLFSPHYLRERMEDTQSWKGLDDQNVKAVFQTIKDTYHDRMPQLENKNEYQTEEDFIRPTFDVLGHVYEVQEPVKRNRRTPDYALFESDLARDNATDRRVEEGNFYQNAIGIADAKRWGRSLDSNGEDDKRDFGNPNYQIHYYLEETSTNWGILTNGKQWRIYYRPTSHKLTSYLQFELSTIIEEDDFEAFKLFYIFFRQDAFITDRDGECFLDSVYEKSIRFSRKLGDDIRDRVYDAIKILGSGFLKNPDNNLSRGDIDVIHDASLTYLYRLIFILYAESESRELLPVDSAKYEQDYSLNHRKEIVCEELEKDEPKYRDYEFELWRKLDLLFALIDRGSKSSGVDESDFVIPSYNGGLFRTDPEDYDRKEAHFLQENQVADSYLAEVIELLAKSEVQESDENEYADYASLDIRHLGSIYEALLEYNLEVATEDLVAIEEDETEIWLNREEYDGDIGDLPTVDEGEVYLHTDQGERKSFGSYYTPEYVVQYIVEESLGPILDEIREELQSNVAPENYAEEFEEKVYNLNILDPAMGSGHFLTGVIDYLATAVVEAEEKQATLIEESDFDEKIETLLPESRENEWVRRQIAQRCVYGVDLQPMAVELAKVSLWMNTLAAKRPLAFLDHHLKTGNSLVGSNIEDIEELPDKTDINDMESEDDDRVQATWGHFGAKHTEAVDYVKELHEELVNIENRDRADTKEMEEKFQEIKEDPRLQRLLSMCDIHTYEQLGNDIPTGAYEKMARAIENDEKWEEVQKEDWFEHAQASIENHEFLHWYLTFPQVFYGDEEAKAGFDVVLGNPPYAPASEWVDPYLRKKYDVPDYFVDLFHVFIEKGLDLLRKEGQFGFIIPEPWLTLPNAQDLREYVLQNSWIRTIIQFEERVFDDRDVTVDTIIMMAEKTSDPGVVNTYYADNSAGTIPELVNTNRTDQELLREYDDYRVEIRRSPDEQEVLDKIRNGSTQLQNNIAEVRIGIQAYNELKHDKTTIEQREFHSQTKQGSRYLPELRGSHINRYYLNTDDVEYLETGEHLHDSPPSRFFKGPRVLIQEITNAGQYMINGVYTDKEYCYYKTVIGVQSTSHYSTHYLLAVINSKAMSWVFPRTSYKIVSDVFPRISVTDTRELPIPTIDFNGLQEDERKATYNDIITEYEAALHNGDAEQTRFQIEGALRAGRSASVHDAVSKFAERMIEYRWDREQLNLDLLSYIQPYDVEGTLEKLARPLPGIQNTKLTKTTTDDSSPEIVRFEFKEKDSNLHLLVDIEYQEEGDSISETVEAFVFRSPSERQKKSIQTFLPKALEESHEQKFAGFLPHATSTISLLDRLRSLEIPKTTDVITGVELYLEEEETAETLDQDIRITNDLLDFSVYRLYGLTSSDEDIIKQGLQRQQEEA